MHRRTLAYAICISLASACMAADINVADDQCESLQPQSHAQLCYRVSPAESESGPPYNNEIILRAPDGTTTVLHKSAAEMMYAGGFLFSTPKKTYVAISWAEPGDNVLRFYRTLDYIHANNNSIKVRADLDNADILQFGDDGVVVYIGNEFYQRDHGVERDCRPARHPISQKPLRKEDYVTQYRAAANMGCLRILDLR